MAVPYSQSEQHRPLHATSLKWSSPECSQGIRFDALFNVSQIRIKLPIETKTKSVRCSMVYATAWVMVMLELKSMRYCNWIVAAETFEEPFPLLSLLRVLS